MCGNERRLKIMKYEQFYFLFLSKKLSWKRRFCFMCEFFSSLSRENIYTISWQVFLIKLFFYYDWNMFHIDLNRRNEFAFFTHHQYFFVLIIFIFILSFKKSSENGTTTNIVHCLLLVSYELKFKKFLIPPIFFILLKSWLHTNQNFKWFLIFAMCLLFTF